jgi:hypothetical protein
MYIYDGNKIKNKETDVFKANRLKKKGTFTTAMCDNVREEREQQP